MSTSSSPTPLNGLHLLLTYQCTFECDHCFVWGGPFQTGTMTLDTVDRILAEATRLGTIEWIYFEGGEAFLFYAILKSGVLRAKEQGFKVGIVSNAYWANSENDALEWLPDSLASLSTSSASRSPKRRTYQALRARFRPVSRPCFTGDVRPNYWPHGCRRHPGRSSLFARGKNCGIRTDCT